MTRGPSHYSRVANGRPRERILAVTTRLFLEEGIRVVSVARIVREADVAPMTLYRHFGGKDGLVAASIERWSTRRVGWITEQVDRCGDDPEARFGALWEALGQRAGPGEPDGSLVAVAAVELRRDPGHPAWSAIAEHRTGLRRLVESLVEPLGVDDPRLLTERLYLLIEGVEAAAVAGERVRGVYLRTLSEAVRRAS
jgi:AcrR family transcriptional regulator